MLTRQIFHGSKFEKLILPKNDTHLPNGTFQMTLMVHFLFHRGVKLHYSCRRGSYPLGSVLIEESALTDGVRYIHYTNRKKQYKLVRQYVTKNCKLCFVLKKDHKKGHSELRRKDFPMLSPIRTIAYW